MTKKSTGGGSKRSGDKMASTAGKVLATGKATNKEALKLAGSVLGQDEHKGKRSK